MELVQPGLDQRAPQSPAASSALHAGGNRGLQHEPGLAAVERG